MDGQNFGQIWQVASLRDIQIGRDQGMESGSRESAKL